MEKGLGKVRWGFIGAGYIAKLALYPALLNSKDGEIYAVGAKDRERGLALSPSGLVYTDYDELLADPKVEAIYISLPNSLHIEWSIKAMRAGKHVLCEKPAAMNVAQLKEAIAVANETGLIFMEASWNRWHPRTLRLKEIVDSGVIGEVKTIRSAFTHAEALTSMNTPNTLYFDVVGTKGRVSMTGNDAFNSHNKPSTLEVEVDGKVTVENFAACDPYQLMADAMSRRIRGGEGWLMPHSQSIAFAEVFERAFEVMGRP